MGSAAAFVKNRALGISVLKLQVLQMYHNSFLAIKLFKESLSFRDLEEKTGKNVNTLFSFVYESLNSGTTTVSFTFSMASVSS